MDVNRDLNEVSVFDTVLADEVTAFAVTPNGVLLLVIDSEVRAYGVHTISNTLPPPLWTATITPCISKAAIALTTSHAVISCYDAHSHVSLVDWEGSVTVSHYNNIVSVTVNPTVYLLTQGGDVYEMDGVAVVGVGEVGKGASILADSDVIVVHDAGQVYIHDLERNTSSTLLLKPTAMVTLIDSNIAVAYPDSNNVTLHALDTSLLCVYTFPNQQILRIHAKGNRLILWVQSKGKTTLWQVNVVSPMLPVLISGVDGGFGWVGVGGVWYISADVLYRVEIHPIVLSGNGVDRSGEVLVSDVEVEGGVSFAFLPYSVSRPRLDLIGYALVQSNAVAIGAGSENGELSAAPTKLGATNLGISGCTFIEKGQFFSTEAAGNALHIICSDATVVASVDTTLMALKVSQRITLNPIIATSYIFLKATQRNYMFAATNDTELASYHIATIDWKGSVPVVVAQTAVPFAMLVGVCVHPDGYLLAFESESVRFFK